MTIDVPRSVLAALWVDALRDPEAEPSVSDALAAIVGEDEPHTVNTVDGAGSLAELLLRAGGGQVAAVLPAPGEPFALGGTAGEAAMEVGEALVVSGPPAGLPVGVGSDGAAATGSFVAVPFVTEFGSALEPGAMVAWRVFGGASRPPAVDSLGEARAGLAEALNVAIEALSRMDVARWREEAAEEISMLASSVVPPALEVRLPPGQDARRTDLLVRAVRLTAIVELARTDDGAAVNAWQADQRSAALRHVAAAARRALTAASASAPRRA
ncbi:hypothetical protein EXU48_17760 [Occultella glacieicola]|uniref:ANTAR domain-containing protein n=1 Tax=Occultella glacieicola TaxID=2518684 RepID=A0ABY2E0S6_9MICO|nr:hypothetical protein [Occultella glacieicola]TDE90314.1 hypothetical protein EXU48_17760 [Occultella glacieicola]